MDIAELKTQGFSTLEAIEHIKEQEQFHNDAMDREEQYYTELVEDHDGRV